MSLATDHRFRQTKRALTVALAGLFAIVSLTGCVKLDVDLTIADDTVNGTMVIAVDRRITTVTGQSEQDLQDGLMKSDLPEGDGITNDPYADGNFIGMQYRLVNAPLATFRPDSDSNTSLAITHDTQAGTYKVTGVMDFTDYNKVPTEMRALLADFEVRIAITFPGTVVSHNGELDGQTVTWRPKVGERLQLEAVASDTARPAWLSVLTVGCPILLILAVAISIVVVIVLRRRKVPTATPVASGEAPPEMGEAPYRYPGQ